MSSTFDAIETARLRAMTPEEKLRALDGLRRTAWLFAEAGVRQRNPKYTEAQVRAEVRRLLSHAAS